MKDICSWVLLCGILAACTCGGRTNECNGHIKLSVLTNIHDDPACETVSKKGVIIYEAAKFIVDARNMKDDNMKIDISVMDTCGSIAGTIKAAIKALVSTGLDCIHAPHHLGIIGPESPLNVDTVQKITSVLNIPHIVKARLSISPYLHHLAKESEYYIVQGILEVIGAMRWHSFTLVTQKNDDDNHDDDIQIIAKKVTMAAIARGLCVVVLDRDNIENASSQIVFIGMPEENFFHKVNGTILIASEGSRATHVSKIDTTNSILFLEDSRDDFNGLEYRVINSKWWVNGSGTNIYNVEELRDVRWLKDAIDIYTTSLHVLCKKKKCSDEINPAEWNSVVSTVMATHNSKAGITPKQLKLFLKRPSNSLEQIGEISVLNNYAKLHWINGNTDEKLKSFAIVPESFVDILFDINDKSKINCATALDQSTKQPNDNSDNDVTRIIFTAFGDHEWWTMVGIVGGIGVTMFTVGFVAVYIVYVNIRGPKASKRNSRRVSRDVSLRQVTTPVHIDHNQRQPQPSPPQRLARYQPRRNSNRSIRSETSDKSV